MIAHGNLPRLAKRIADRRLAVQVFRMHVHAYNLRIFIGGIIVKALIRIAAGGIDCIVILAVRCLYAAARHLHGTQDTEKLGNWGHINAKYEYTCGHARRILIYSPEMKEWLTKADEKLIMYPVFPLEMKGKEIIKS